MAHITLPENAPGIRGPMMYRPDTALQMNALADVLLYKEHSLTQGEREMIATAVSYANECKYCSTVHKAIAAHQLGGNYDLVQAVMTDPMAAPVSDKLKALLTIALTVRESGANVTPEMIDAARRQGATDIEIHDTVLIAASFCMFNRYVDGLATWAPDDPAIYDTIGKQRAAVGYSAPPIPLPTP